MKTLICLALIIVSTAASATYYNERLVSTKVNTFFKTTKRDRFSKLYEVALYCLEYNEERCVRSKLYSIEIDKQGKRSVRKSSHVFFSDDEVERRIKYTMDMVNVRFSDILEGDWFEFTNPIATFSTAAILMFRQYYLLPLVVVPIALDLTILPFRTFRKTIMFLRMKSSGRKLKKHYSKLLENIRSEPLVVSPHHYFNMEEFNFSPGP